MNMTASIRFLLARPPHWIHTIIGGIQCGRLFDGANGGFPAASSAAISTLMSMRLLLRHRQRGPGPSLAAVAQTGLQRGSIDT